MEENHGSVWYGLAALVAGCLLLALRVLSLHDVYGPVIYGDEFIYWRNMKALFASQGPLNSGYPPFYSFLMGLGGLWPDTYRGVLLVNILAGCILPFTAWRLSRSCSGCCRIGAVVLVSTLPVLLIYPRLMMSENLFLPLLGLALWAFWTASSDSSPWSAFLAGVILLLACMTRYQGVFFAVGAVMALLMAGLWEKWFGPDRTAANQALKRWVLKAVVIGGVPAAGILLWKWLGIPNSWEIGQTASYIYRHGLELTPKLAGMWLALYLSYLVLSLLPFLPPLLHAGWSAVEMKSRSTPSLAVLGFLVGSTGISLVVAARHSALVEYNHPDPSHIMGRYLIFLPVLGALTLLFLPEMKDPFRTRGRGTYLLIWLCCAILGLLAYGVLVRGWFFELSSWFLMRQTALDVFVYKSGWMVLMGAVLTGLFFLLPGRMPYLAALAVFLSFSAFTCRTGFLNNADGPEAFTRILEDTLKECPSGLVGTSSRAWFREVHQRYYLNYKGIDLDRVLIGEGFDNPEVRAVIRMETGVSPSAESPLFTARDGMTLYRDYRKREPNPEPGN